MGRHLKRKATASVHWVQPAEHALRVALTSAIVNLDTGPKTSYPEVIQKISVTVDGEKQEDWEIARASIGTSAGVNGVQELLLARMLVDEQNINYATDYLLVLFHYRSRNRKPSRYVVPCIVRIDHENYRSGRKDSGWLRDWDEALGLLIEEAIGNGQIP